MQQTPLCHQLETLHDGLTTFRHGEPVPSPLLTTQINVRVMAGLAIVTTVRRFRNAEDSPIEAVLTFPVGFDAVVTGLIATVDGRRLIGTAKEASEARDDYEDALDEGRLGVLHEEALRGIHVLSVGALRPSGKVEVELQQVVPLADAGGVPFLRLPMTAGQVYGASPLLPSDDLATAVGVRHEAVLKVSTDQGRAVMDGRILAPDQSNEILLDRAVELRIEGGAFGTLGGRSADGRAVELSFEAAQSGEAMLDVHVIVDRSGSTGSTVGDGTTSVWQAMRDGLVWELSRLRPTDRVTLWQFDNECECIGSATGEACSKLAARLDGPRGGTELGEAVRAAIGSGAKDVLVLTDGQTWAHIVDDLKAERLRISAILAGPGSLDANIGHLCALTGGQVLYAPGRDVGAALRSAFAGLRFSTAATEGRALNGKPDWLAVRRGGVAIQAFWSNVDGREADSAGVAVGRFAAALALPLLEAKAGEAWAKDHCLCTHSTSLVLVDDAGEATEGLSQLRKVPLMALNKELVGKSYRSARAVSMSRSIGQTSRAPEDVIGSYAFRTGPRTFESLPIHLGDLDSPSNAMHQDFDAATALFANIAWDAHGDDFLEGDLTGLSNRQTAAVEQLAAGILSDSRWKAASTEERNNASIFALGLIARRTGDRLAMRFARRALKGAPKWVLALA